MTDTIFNAVVGILGESLHVLLESAPYMLLGFFFAGLIKGFVPDGFVARAMGRRSAGSVLRASLVGVPLPLCSCSVLPTALGLRKQGASKGATTAFLISTPETGVDSIAVTYALLGPFMAVVRPVAAFISATFAGLMADKLDREVPAPDLKSGLRAPQVPEPPTLQTLSTIPGSESGGCTGGCCGGGCSSESSSDGEPASVRQRFQNGMRYAFGEMMGDIGVWFLVGTLAAGVIGYFIPAGFLADPPGGEWGGLIAMLVVGLPLYVCASTSTPIAASLMLKGLSPGAALVFLLAGPATNGATLTVVLKLLGRRIAVVYVASIAASALVLGWLVNRLTELVGFSGLDIVASSEHEGHGLLAAGSAVLLVVLIVAAWWRGRRAHRHSQSHDAGRDHEHGPARENSSP